MGYRDIKLWIALACSLIALTLIPANAMIAAAQTTKLLKGIPVYMQVSQVQKTRTGELLDHYRICFNIYNKKNSGTVITGHDWPAKVITQVNGYNSMAPFYTAVDIESDWSPLESAKLQWFDKTFRMFSNGNKKPISVSVSPLRELIYDGYRYCEEIPFAKVMSEHLLVKKLSFPLVPARLEWQAAFKLNFYRHGVKFPFDYQSAKMALPALGITWRESAQKKFGDIPVIYATLNLKQMIEQVKDFDLAIEAANILSIPDIEPIITKIRANCNAPGESPVSYSTMAKIIKICLRPGQFAP